MLDLPLKSIIMLCILNICSTQKMGPHGDLGTWREWLFIFRELGSTGNYFQELGEQVHNLRDLGSPAKKKVKNLILKEKPSFHLIFTKNIFAWGGGGGGGSRPPSEHLIVLTFVLTLVLVSDMVIIFYFCGSFPYNCRFTGPRSAVGNVSGYRCVSDCRSRGREFDSGPVPYFRGD